MAAAEPVISLRDVRKDYQGLRPLRVNRLELHEAESVAVLGIDGVAAEALVNLITGATLPDSGAVDVFGDPTAAIDDPDAWLTAMDRFGIVSDRVALLDGFSIEQNLALPLTLELDAIPPAVRAVVRELADEAGISADTLPVAAAAADPELQLRVRLARALALGPRVLLAEHPAASLAPDRARRFAADLAGVASRRRLTLLVMTADRTIARAVSKRVLVLAPATGDLTPEPGWRERWWRRARLAPD